MTPIPHLTTDRFILRAPKAADIDPMAAFYASPASQFVSGPKSRPITWRYLCEVIGHWQMRGYGRWSVTTKDDDTALGLVGLHCPEDWPEPEVGWMLYPGATGQGIATEAGHAARAYAYDVLGWSTIISMIDPENVASVNVAERMGARREDDFVHARFGKVGIWRHPAPEKASA